MPLLADKNVRARTVQALRDAGYDVEAVADWQRDPGDLEILRYALAEERVVSTRDRDFGTLVFRDDEPHAGVLYFRLHTTPAAEEIARPLGVLRTYGWALQSGVFLAVELQHVRGLDP